MGENIMVAQAVGKLLIAKASLLSMDWERMTGNAIAIQYMVNALRDDVVGAIALLEESQPPRSGLDKVQAFISEEDELRARAEAAEKDADTWKRRAELLMGRHRGAAFHAFLCCHPQRSFDKRKHLEAASVRSAFRAIRDHLNGLRTWEGCEACQHEAKAQQSQGDTPFPEASVVWERLDAAVEGEEVEQDG